MLVQRRIWDIMMNITFVTFEFTNFGKLVIMKGFTVEYSNPSYVSCHAKFPAVVRFSVTLTWKNNLEDQETDQCTKLLFYYRSSIKA